MATCSVLILQWFTDHVQRDLYSDPNLSKLEYKYRILANFEENIDFKFQYLFSVSIACLVFRVAVMLQFSESIGPLIKIVGKMVQDFLNFFIMYFILLVMFAIVGNMNFLFELE